MMLNRNMVSYFASSHAIRNFQAVGHTSLDKLYIRGEEWYYQHNGLLLLLPMTSSIPLEMDTEREKTFDYRSVWDKLKDKLEDELDDYHTQEALTLMKDKLFLPMDVYMDITHPRQILEHLENNYSEKECIEILRHVFNFMHLHVVSEGKNFSEVINECEKQLPGDRIDLIGRDEQIHDVMKIVVENKYKGIWLCGMGGMGKTTLAEEICYRLQYNLNYRFFKVDMKGKNSLIDLNQEILIAQNLMWREYGERLNELEPSATSSKESILNLQVRQSLPNFSYESVLLLDNMDDLQRKDGKKLSFYLTDLLSDISKLGEQCKVIITARYKFLDSLVKTEPNNSSGNGEIHLREIEIRGLSEEDGQKLAMKSASPRKLEVQECSQVAKACGGCPLAICMMSRYIRRQWKYPVKEVLYSIKHRHSDIVDCCIENSFDDLPQETKEQFIQLFVFNVCPFNVQSAAAIWFEDTSEHSIAKTEMVFLQLKHRHMVECGRPCDESTHGLLVNGEMDAVTYSLHPLVFSSRDTLLRREGLDNSMNLSKARFLELYLNKLLLLEERLERERKQALQIVASDKVHFQDIFMWNSTLTFSTASSLKLIYSLGIKTSKLLTTFAKIINKAEEALTVFENLAKNSKELNNVDAFVFWSVQQAEACVNCDMDDKAVEILQHLPIEGQDYGESESTNDVYKLFTAAEFHYVRGMLFNKSKDYCGALRELDKSLELYKTCKPEESFTVYQAAAINARGNVYFKLENFSSALKCHQTAYDLIIRRVGGDFHEHKAVYLHNIGSINHAKALQKWDKNKTKANGLLEKALKTYDECIKQDVANKQTSDSYYAERLRIRSDIYLKMKYFDEAIADCETALKVQKDLHVTKHPSITISRYKLARCYMKRAKEYKKTLFKEDAKRYLDKCWLTFVQVQEDIKEGGLSPRDQHYANISFDHLKLVKRHRSRQEYWKLEKFYNRFKEKGRRKQSGSPISDSESSDRMSPSSDEDPNDSVQLDLLNSRISESSDSGSSQDGSQSIPNLDAISLVNTTSVKEEVIMDDANIRSGIEAPPERIDQEDATIKKRGMKRTLSDSDDCEEDQMEVSVS